MKIYATVLWAILMTMPFSAFGDTCPLEKSVYQDLDNKGFLLEFGPPHDNGVRNVHSATITHPRRGTLFDFNLMFGMGYAAPFLTLRDADEELSKPFHLHFFDKNLRSMELDKSALPYAFIDGLGPADWYGVQADTTARKIPIGTPLWRFVRCSESTNTPGANAANKRAGSTETLSSAESIASDGQITAYGEIKDVGNKDGRRFLSIDYGEWISEKECKRRVKAGSLNLDEADCEVDSLRYINQNPKLRQFTVADDVQIVIPHPSPSRPTKKMSWDQFVKMERTRSEDTRELWDGLWKIFRSGKIIKRIEWAYTP